MGKMAARVVVERDGEGRLVVRKVGLPGDDKDRQAEAEWLRRAAGPGVVELVVAGAPPVGIVTAHAGSHTWRTSSPEPAPAAVLLASALRTVARLHRQGLVHGALVPDHLIVSGGETVLCSPDPSATGQALDRGALADLAQGSLQRWRSDGVSVPEADRWARTIQLLSSPNAGWSLGDIADVLAPPAPASPGRSRRVTSRRQRTVPVKARALLAATIVIAFTAIGGLVVAGRTSPVPLSAARPIDGPSVDLLGTRYRGGQPDDVLVATTRPCPGSPPAAVLEPSSGTVWVFSRLPSADAPERGLATQQVPGASRVAVRELGSCEQVIVSGPAGEAAVPAAQE